MSHGILLSGTRFKKYSLDKIPFFNPFLLGSFLLYDFVAEKQVYGGLFSFMRGLRCPTWITPPLLRRDRTDPTRTALPNGSLIASRSRLFHLSAPASKLASLPNKNAPRYRERRLLPDLDYPVLLSQLRVDPPAFALPK